jgi:Flp pilus assembly protein TadD
MKTWRWIITALWLASAAALPVSATANMGDDEPESTANADAVAGKKAVEAKDWKRAVELLTKAAAAEPNNADVQNWLGFAQRKQGNLDAAFAAYDKALKLNPRHKAAHEYIGEAYLISGKLPQAEQHLAELRKLCTPIPCEEYKDLRRAVDEYKKNNKK